MSISFSFFYKNVVKLIINLLLSYCVFTKKKENQSMSNLLKEKLHHTKRIGFVSTNLLLRITTYYKNRRLM